MVRPCDIGPIGAVARPGWPGWVLAVLLGAGLAGCSDEATSPPALSVSPTEIQLALRETSRALEVSNRGQGRLTWALEDDAAWLAADPVAGATGDREQVMLTVLPDSLPHGPHVATVTITSNGGDATVRVRMWEALVVEPDTLRLDGDTPAGQVRLLSLDGLALSWSAATAADWLQASPSEGVLGEAPETLLVVADMASLAPGPYAASVTIDAGAFGAGAVGVLLDVPQRAAVSGRVYFQGTRIPAPGVRVSTGQIADTTDAQGAYELAAVPLGARTLTAAAEGFTTLEVAITVPEAGLTRDLEIASDGRTYRITGRLTNILTNGLVNATVTLLNPDGSSSSISTRTRAEGAYSLEHVPAGLRRVRFAALQYQDLVAEIEVPDADVAYDARAVAAIVRPPDPVSGPTVTRLDCGRVRVAWSPSLLAGLETVAGYRVERAPAAQGPFADAGGLIAGSGTSYFDDTELDAPRAYYRVLTETIDGDPGPPTAATAFTRVPWVRLSPAPLSGHSPEERWGHATVYDPGDGHPRMLLIGGTGCTSGTCGIDFSDVWALDLTEITWELMDSGAGGPADRNEHSVVLDNSRRRAIVYGGKLSEGERIYGDTWAFDLGSRQWVELHAGPGASPAPPARYGHVAVLDAAGDRMLVYGGRGQSLWNDVWSFSLATGHWTQLRTGESGEPGPQPLGRFDHVAAIDPIARRMVVHGGLGGIGSITLADTWAFELDGATWMRLPDGPERCRHMMDYDPAGHRAVFFGGWRYGSGGQGSARFHDTQALDLSTGQWQEIDGGDEALRPERRDRHSMVLRPDGGALYIFGGLLELTGLGADTWTFCAGER